MWAFVVIGSDRCAVPLPVLSSQKPDLLYTNPASVMCSLRVLVDSAALKAKNGRVSYLIGPSTLASVGWDAGESDLIIQNLS